VTQTSGVVYSIVGLVAAIAGIASPNVVTRRAVEERRVDDAHGDRVIHITE
jgi:hypothetical protein